MSTIQLQNRSKWATMTYSGSPMKSSMASGLASSSLQKNQLVPYQSNTQLASND